MLGFCSQDWCHLHTSDRLVCRKSVRLDDVLDRYRFKNTPTLYIAADRSDDFQGKPVETIWTRAIDS